MKINFSKSEIKHLVAASIILGFIFSFTEWGTTVFNPIAGIQNWLKAIILSLIALLIHVFAHKFLALKSYATAEFRTWSIQRYGFRKSSTYPIKTAGFSIPFLPIGIILSLFVAFLSAGKGIFAAVESFIITDVKTEKRISRKLSEYSPTWIELTETELAFISLLAPIVSTLLAVIFLNTPFHKFGLINMYIAIYSMFPFPGLDGIKILFGSIWIYLLGILFVGISLGFAYGQILSFIPTIILSLVLSIILTLLGIFLLNK
ncbi:MAG TPA: hypothetical protein VJJ23_02060 [Candidatus Nanoarchaeia archaeon]|nr:hypothetical protein [Candidatus Nanoarchaeia archaeon]